MKKLALFLLLAGGCIATRGDSRPSEHASLSNVPILQMPLNGYLGLTVCVNDSPTIILNDTLSGFELESTVVHELVHAKQAQDKGCVKDAARYASDRLYRLDEEAQAYCTELAYRRARGHSNGLVADQHWLFMYLRAVDTTATARELTSAAEKFCGG